MVPKGVHCLPNLWLERNATGEVGEVQAREMTLNLLGGSQGITRPSEMGGTAAEVGPVSRLNRP